MMNILILYTGRPVSISMRLDSLRKFQGARWRSKADVSRQIPRLVFLDLRTALEVAGSGPDTPKGPWRERRAWRDELHADGEKMGW
jgi:hypothetical protein